MNLLRFGAKSTRWPDHSAGQAHAHGVAITPFQTGCFERPKVPDAGDAAAPR
jgi:hypothetical protein